jgi:hypothetical protein
MRGEDGRPIIECDSDTGDPLRVDSPGLLAHLRWPQLPAAASSVARKRKMFFASFSITYQPGDHTGSESSSAGWLMFLISVVTSTIAGQVGPLGVLNVDRQATIMLVT